MKELLMFIITFTVVYLVYLIAVILRKNNKSKLEDSVEFRWLEKMYKINIKKVNLKTLNQIIALSNSFIIAITFTLVNFIKIFLFKMLVGFVILIILELLIYHIIGKYFKHKEEGK